jgi:hypothetical protein
MSEREQTHPDRAELTAFGLGQLDEERSAALEVHLADCRECAQVLEGLGSDSFLNQLRAATAPAALDNSTGIGSAAREAPTISVAAPGPTTNLLVPPELANHPRYRIVRVLGVGGMGIVYEATHLLMERPVALKVINRSLTQDPQMVERFRREVRAAARLAHSNIVTAFDAEQAGDLHFLVMEYVEGTSLQQVLTQCGRLPVMQACDYVRQVALGLQHAHERGMVHRDIKPANLLRTPHGQIKILDFGLARFARESAPVGPAPITPPPGEALTQIGCLMGTPGYMAPEQIRNPHTADIRADLYSLGCTLYHLLAGQGPFATAGDLEKLVAPLQMPPEPLTKFRQDVLPGLVAVIERLIARDPAQRYQTPAEVVRALEPYTDGGAVGRPAVSGFGGVGRPAPSADRLAPSADASKEMPAPGSRLRKVVLAGAFFGVPVLLCLALIPSPLRETLSPAMEILYLVCAVLGVTVLAFQFLLGLVGLGHHHDAGDSHDLHDTGDHDGHGQAHDDHEGHEQSTSRFARVLTLRTLVAGLTFFGLAGRAAVAGQMPSAVAFLLALGAGAGALYGVAWLMRVLERLRAEGTTRIEGAVGRTGTVYLTIPAARTGAGKVLLNLQNRTVEYQAVTAASSLPTGTSITVVAVVSPGTVEVIPADSSKRLSHV